MSEHQGVARRTSDAQPAPLTVEQIVRWAHEHRARTGAWPGTTTPGIIPGTRGEKWKNLDEALRSGRRGLPAGTSLMRLLAERCGVRNRNAPPPLTVEQILAWADGYHGRTGRWPVATSGAIPEAETEWRAVVAERPDFLPAWLMLGELCRTQRRWADLDEVVRRLEALPQGRLEAAVLTARGELARGGLRRRAGAPGTAIAGQPQALWPRVILSHILLQEGRDLAAAEQALREVLALDPQHAEARSNLAVLLRQRQAADAVFTSDRLGEGL
jgi:hypothetical protein